MRSVKKARALGSVFGANSQSRLSTYFRPNKQLFFYRAYSSTSHDNISLGTQVLQTNEVGISSRPVRPLVTPIYNSSTYKLESSAHGAALSDRQTPPEGHSEFLYSRWDNPTAAVAGELISDLEGGKAGYTFASGMAAVSSTLFGILKSGDHCIAQNPVYGGTHEALELLRTRFGVQVTRVSDFEVSSIAKALQPNTRIIYVESPANPLCAVMDLGAIGQLAKQHRQDTKRDHLLTIIDSTFASPINQQPIVDHGFDIVIHSCTKYLAGHSDLTAGAVVTRTQELAHEIWEARKMFGGVLSAYDAFLLLRGIKTLDIRVRKQNENALKIAEWLEKHPKVECVYYPGLKANKYHEVQAKNLRKGGGFGGMLSFNVVGGEVSGKKAVESLKLIHLAVSLGGVESLINHAASTTHAMVPREERLKGGITDGLIRFSVGIEDPVDLINDLDQALRRI